MVQATDPSPARYFAAVAQSRAVLSDAAEGAAIAGVLGALVDFLSAVRQRRTETTGISMALTRLAAHGPMRSADLAASLQLDQSTVSRHVAQLESEGLVERIPMPGDRRAHLIQLTERGVTAAHERVLEIAAELEGVLRDWPREDLRTFSHLLERFTQGLLHERRDA